MLAFCLSVPSVSLAHSEGDDNAHEGKMRYYFNNGNSETGFVKVKCYARKNNDSDDWDLDEETLQAGDDINCDRTKDGNTDYGYIMIAWHKTIAYKTFKTRRYYRGHCTDDHSVENCSEVNDDVDKYGTGAQTRYYFHCSDSQTVKVRLLAEDGDEEASEYGCVD